MVNIYTKKNIDVNSNQILGRIESQQTIKTMEKSSIKITVIIVPASVFNYIIII